MLLWRKRHPDTLIDQTKNRPQETPDFRLNKQMETFSFNPPINLADDGKWLLAVMRFEASNSVFIVTDENNTPSNSTPSHWNSEDGDELINKVNKLLELRSENDIELHVEEVRKKESHIKIGDKLYIVSDLDTRKIETIEELKNIEYM